MYTLGATSSPIYLDIPILAAFKIDISNHVKFAINIGPYLSVGMGGKYELTNTGGHKNESHNPFKSSVVNTSFGTPLFSSLFCVFSMLK